MYIKITRIKPINNMTILSWYFWRQIIYDHKQENLGVYKTKNIYLLISFQFNIILYLLLSANIIITDFRSNMKYLLYKCAYFKYIKYS